jgi:hypothetical protein
MVSTDGTPSAFVTPTIAVTPDFENDIHQVLRLRAFNDADAVFNGEVITMSNASGTWREADPLEHFDPIAVGAPSAAPDNSYRWFGAMIFSVAPTEAQTAQLYAWVKRQRTVNDYEGGLGAPDVLRTDTTVIDGALDIVAGDDAFIVADVTFGGTPTGTILEIGGGSNGAYLGITAGELVWRIGNGAAPPQTDQARVAVSAAPYAGARWLVIAEASVANDQARLWIQQADDDGNPIGSATLLGAVTAGAALTSWTGTGDGAFTTTSGTTLAGEDLGAWNGTGHELRIYNSTSAPASLPSS